MDLALANNRRMRDGRKPLDRKQKLICSTKRVNRDERIPPKAFETACLLARSRTTRRRQRAHDPQLDRERRDSRVAHARWTRRAHWPGRVARDIPKALGISYAYWSLWVPYLHRAWLKKTSRVAIERSLTTINTARNRASHYDPLFDAQPGRDFAAAHPEVLRLSGLLLPELADYIRGTTVPTILATRP